MRTANSSPPSRATRSPSRTSPVIRSVTATRSASPAAWPSVSLTTLKSSRSRNRTAVTPSAGRAGRSRLEDPLERQLEHPPVGRPGQRVALGQVLDVLEEDRIAQVERGDRGELPEHRGDPPLDPGPPPGAMLDDDRPDGPPVGDHRRDEDVPGVGQETRPGTGRGSGSSRLTGRSSRRSQARRTIQSGVARGGRGLGRAVRGQDDDPPVRLAEEDDRARSRTARRAPRGRSSTGGRRRPPRRAGHRRRRAPGGRPGAGAARAR